MTEREIKIEAERARFLVHLLSSGNIEQACKAARIGKQKAYSWLREPSFQQELKARRSEQVSHALELLQAASVEAVQRLRELLHCGKPATECRAAGLILELAVKGRELEDFDRRIARLEEISESEGRAHEANGRAN